jgi:hypothetical protein
LGKIMRHAAVKVPEDQLEAGRRGLKDRRKPPEDASEERGQKYRNIDR